MSDYLISGTFRVFVTAESKEEALEKFDDLSISDLDRIDVNDIEIWE